MLVLAGLLAPAGAVEVPTSVPGPEDRVSAPALAVLEGTVVVGWWEGADRGVRPVCLAGDVSRRGLVDVVGPLRPEGSLPVAVYSVAPMVPWRARAGVREFLWAVPSRSDELTVCVLSVVTRGSERFLQLQTLNLYQAYPVRIRSGSGFPTCAMVGIDGRRVLVVYRDGDELRARVLVYVKDEGLGREVWKWLAEGTSPWTLTLESGVSGELELRAVVVGVGGERCAVVSVRDSGRGVTRLLVLRLGDRPEVVARFNLPGNLGPPAVPEVSVSGPPARIPVVCVGPGGELVAYALRFDGRGWRLEGPFRLGVRVPAWVRPVVVRVPDGFAAIVGGSALSAVVFGFQGGGVRVRYRVSLARGGTFYRPAAVSLFRGGRYLGTVVACYVRRGVGVGLWLNLVKIRRPRRLPVAVPVVPVRRRLRR